MFRVGDIVVANEKSYVYSITNRDYGCYGVVTRVVNRDIIHIQVLECDYYNSIGVIYEVHANCFDLSNKDMLESIRFKKGDTINDVVHKNRYKICNMKYIKSTEDVNRYNLRYGDIIAKVIDDKGRFRDIILYRSGKTVYFPLF